MGGNRRFFVINDKLVLNSFDQICNHLSEWGFSNTILAYDPVAKNVDKTYFICKIYA